MLGRGEREAFALHLVLAVLVILGRGGIEREVDVLARLVAGLLDRLEDEVQRLAGAAELGGEAALVAETGRHARRRELFLQGVEDFRAHAHRLADVFRADRHDHEFLDVDRVVRVLAAIDDVHHRHREDAGGGAANVAIERLGGELGRGLGGGEADAENGVGAETALVVGAVELDHRAVDGFLLGGVEAHQRLGDLAVDRGHGIEHALAHVAALVAVAALMRLVHAGRGTRGHGGAAQRAVFQHDVDLDRGVATAVEDLAGVNVDDGAHGCVPRLQLGLSEL
ncbi:probable phosphopyruvate hydratase [Salipiger bermudensis HTCC2601]|uniref:Probable phosphopyruvate hydratase n=1 Tax=Salipiger bermudensis (strain DSM 26914 / JCM 13377 / KCTC 12554 / HTCC2601) TaxID=314265 RepID=Q0FHW8_SALBH|nr:probable phosphopyruvate hydratase [Salipiger bermudensis HTCC2601]